MCKILNLYIDGDQVTVKFLYVKGLKVLRKNGSKKKKTQCVNFWNLTLDLKGNFTHLHFKENKIEILSSTLTEMILELPGTKWLKKFKQAPKFCTSYAFTKILKVSRASLDTSMR